MKQRRKILLALLLSASVAATPIASAVPAFAENPDFTASAEFTDTPEEETSAETEASASEDFDSATTDTDVFSAGEVEYTAEENVSDQADAESRTHSINVTVGGKTTGIYAFKNVVVTQQDDGTYLVRMQSTSDVRDYIAFADDNEETSREAVYNHEVDWYQATTITKDDGTKELWYTVPVKSLTDTLYVAYSSEKNLTDPWKKPPKQWDRKIYALQFDTTSMADTTESDAVASDIHVVPATVIKAQLTPTNNTGMFKVTSALYRKDETGTTLTITLSGKGYHYLYKGTYEEAVANGNNQENWIKGEEVNGVWTFTIPVSDGETYLPLVVISNKYLTNFENGESPLERAFYPRQAVIDTEAKTLVTGDYDYTRELTVSNSVKMFRLNAATLETIGGPNSNGYEEVLHLTMGSTSFDKVFIGSAEDAAKADTTTPITDTKADLVLREGSWGGAGFKSDNLEKDVVISFHSVRNDSWYERIFNISKTNSTLTVTPVSVPATEITLDTDSQTLDAGTTFKLTATVTPADTTDAVTWSSSDETVATVSEDGTVTGIKEGTAVITATAGNVKAECTVTVKVPATKITLNTVKKSLKPGKSFTLKATVAPSDTTDAVEWSSSNAKVAKVSENGTVTAVKEGTAVITAKAGNVEATCTVTVKKAVVKVTKVAVSATPSRNVAAGKKVQLKATVTPSKATNKAVTWKSSNTKYATVDSKGLVTFKKNAGGKTVTITATAKDGSKKYGKVTLTCMKGSVKSIKLSGTTTIKAGKSTTLKAKVSTQNGKANTKLTWTSSNTKIATVNSKGKVTAVKGKKGTVKITAKATDGSRKTATITIKVK